MLKRKDPINIRLALVVFLILYFAFYFFKIPRYFFKSVHPYVIVGGYVFLFILGLYIFKDVFKQDARWVREHKLKFIIFFIVSLLGLNILEYITSIVQSFLFSFLHVKQAYLENDTRVVSAVLDLFPVISIGVIGIVGPVVEEMVYRLFLMSRLNRYGSKTVSVLVSSLLFAVAHLSTWNVAECINILNHFVIGVVFALIYLKTKNIFLPIAVHIFINVTSILPIILGG